MQTSCDDEKLLIRGEILVSLRSSLTLGIVKMPVINPQTALAHPRTHKTYPAWIVNPQR